MSVTLLKPIYKNELETKVERLRELDREVKKLSKIASELKTDICNQMGDQQVIYNAQGHMIATYTEQTSNTFDKVRFELSYPGQYENFTIKKVTKVFRLK